MDMEPVIAIEGLTKDYQSGLRRRQRLRAVDHLSLEVMPGEVFGFLGPNGAGKTTTMKLILRLLFPTAGTISLFGRPVDDASVRSAIGFLPENPYFYDHLTARELLDYFARLFGLDQPERTTRIERLLELVALDPRAHDLPLGKLSRGMLMRVGIAQALVNDPKLVILDEPMAGLDPIGRVHIRDLLSSLREQGRTIFFSTHILSDAEAICDRVAILRRGRLVALGSLSELLSQVNSQAMEIIALNLDEAACRSLTDLGAQVYQTGSGLRIEVKSESNLYEALQIIHQRNGRLISVNPTRGWLESFFENEAML
jgi:ABC-2 type transport system ATP-binding protein